MKGDNFLSELRTAGMLGLSLTLTGRQCQLLSSLIDSLDGPGGRGETISVIVAKRDELKREVMP